MKFTSVSQLAGLRVAINRLDALKDEVIQLRDRLAHAREEVAESAPRAGASDALYVALRPEGGPGPAPLDSAGLRASEEAEP